MQQSPVIFDARYVTRPANKLALADAIWALMPKDVVGSTGSGVQHTMTSADCTQTTSQEDMDMPLLCSTESLIQQGQQAAIH